MPIKESSKWSARDLSHRFTVGFFASQYGDSPEEIVRSNSTKNKTLTFYNNAGSNPDTNAKICAGLCISYMEANGIAYEPSFKEESKDARGLCLNRLTKHLKDGDGTVLFTADIVDHYFRFINEE